MVYGRSFVTAVHHTVCALGITGLRAIVFPFRCVQQLLKRIGIAVLEQIARFLPAEDVGRGHSPWRASIGALPHQELEEKGRMFESPALLAVRQDRAEQPPRARPAQEVLL